MHVLIVDDHALFRSGLRFLLSELDPGAVFTEAAGVGELPPFEKNEAPALVLLDLKLRGTSGLDALTAMRRALPAASVVALSGEEDPAVIRAVIDAGAAGFIPKSSTPQVLIGALRLVLAGGRYLPMDVLDAPPAPQHRATPGPLPAPASPLARLSTRQRDALMLAVRGKSNKLIARELSVAEGTVKQHLSAAFRVLGVANRTEAVFATAALGAAR